MNKKTIVMIIIGIVLLLSLGLLFNPTANGEEILVKSDNKEYVKIKLTGAILFPGEYEGEVGDTLGSLIQKAGGFLENADYDKLNLAQKINDNISVNIDTLTNSSTPLYLPHFKGTDEYAFICGAVNSPGVYPISKNMTIYDLIELAGGLRCNANLVGISLSEEVVDQMKIIIPFKDGIDAGSSLINLNVAGVGELTTLKGIGKSKAEAIINYRKQNGGFKSINELLNISGIGDGIFNQIKDYITV